MDNYNKNTVNTITDIIIKGKSSTADFSNFGIQPFGWANGYSDDNIIWEH